MIRAYLRLLVLRWSRRPGPLLVLGLVVVVPVVVLEVAGLLVRFGWSAERNPYRLPDLELTQAMVTLIGTYAVANLVAAAIHDERVGRRSVLLRVGNLDGVRPVASFLALGIGWGLMLSFAGHAAAWLDGALAGRDPSLGPWLTSLAMVTLISSGVAPLAAGAGFLLPRPVALAVVNLTTPPLVFVPFRWLGREMDWSVTYELGLAVLVLNLACLGGLAPLWRRFSDRAWA